MGVCGICTRTKSYREEGGAFLQQIVTGDETWVQAKIKPWNGNMSLPRTEKFRSVCSTGKVMLIQFWHFDGPILGTTRIVDR
jgi:hypothetical protein